MASARSGRTCPCPIAELRPRWGSGSACWPDWQDAGRITIHGGPDSIHPGNVPGSLRHLLVPVHTDGVLIEADLTAAHAHLTAAITGDPQLTADLNADPDLPYRRIGFALRLPEHQQRAAGKAVMNPCLNGCRWSPKLHEALAKEGITTTVDPLAAFEACYPGVARWHAQLSALDPSIGFASPLGLVFRPPGIGATRKDGTPRSYLGSRTAIVLQHTETVGMLRALEALALRPGRWDAARGRWDRDTSASPPPLELMGATVRGWLYDGLLVEAPAAHAAAVTRMVTESMLDGLASAMRDAAAMYGGRGTPNLSPAVTVRLARSGGSWTEAEAAASPPRRP